LNILITTLGMLALIALSTYARLEHRNLNCLLKVACEAHWKSSEDSASIHSWRLWKKSRKMIEEVRDRNPIETAHLTKKSVCLEAYQMKERLNLAGIQLEASSEKIKTGANLYQIAARLIRNLYKDMEQFQKIPDLEYHILDNIYAAMHPNTKDPSQLRPITATVHLSAVPFKDPQMREAYYALLRGSKTHPSLLDYFKLEGKGVHGVNRNRVPEAIVAAIIGNPVAAKKFIEERRAHHDGGLHKWHRKTYTSTPIDKEWLEAFLKREGIDPALENFFNKVDS